MTARSVMVTLLGTLGWVAEGCGPCSATEPPPSYVPSYTAGEALTRFRGSACARALGDSQVDATGLRGYRSETSPVVLLDLEVTTPPSASGVRYRTATSIGLVPETGDVADPETCAGNLAALVGGVARAVAAAEASPEVRGFLAHNAPADRVVATFEGHVQPRGRIVYSAPRPEGPPALLTWE